MKNNDFDKLYSLKDAEEESGIKVPMWKKLLANGEVSVVKVGVKNFLRASVIEKYIADNTIEASL